MKRQGDGLWEARGIVPDPEAQAKAAQAFDMDGNAGISRGPNYIAVVLTNVCPGELSILDKLEPLVWIGENTVRFAGAAGITGAIFLQYALPYLHRKKALAEEVLTHRAWRIEDEAARKKRIEDDKANLPKAKC